MFSPRPAGLPPDDEFSKWISKSGEQSMISSQPEVMGGGGRGGRGAPSTPKIWEGSHIALEQSLKFEVPKVS